MRDSLGPSKTHVRAPERLPRPYSPPRDILTLTPDATTTPRKKKIESVDRFVPDLSIGEDRGVRFQWAYEKAKDPQTPTYNARKYAENSDVSVTSAIHQQAVYNQLFRGSINPEPTPTPTKRNLLFPSTQECLTKKTRLLKKPASRLGSVSAGPVLYDNPFLETCPLEPETRALLDTPRLKTRKVAKVPYKVLDAPELADDYYLNLLDWSSTNKIAVGLGSNVYTWDAHTAQGNTLAVGTSRGEVQIWDVAHGQKVRTITEHTARVGVLAWNGQVVTSGSRDHTIVHFDCRAPSRGQTDSDSTGGALIRRIKVHRQEVCGLKWNAEENKLASGGNDNRLFVWNGFEAKPLQKYSEHEAAVKAIAWSPHTSDLLASGGGTADRHLRFWNTSLGTSSSIAALDTGSQVCNVAWSKTSNELVSTHGYSLNQIVIWKYPSMQQVAALTGHSLRVLYLAMSPDGQQICTGAGDETLRFWNVFAKSQPPGKRNTELTRFMQLR